MEFFYVIPKWAPPLCVGKKNRPNVVGKFEVFYHKKQNAEFYQYSVQQKSNFYQ